jgi:integral membrane protein (TIGR00529 family)
LIHAKVPLGVSLVLGAAGAAMAFGMGPVETGGAFLSIGTSADTLMFVAMVSLVLVLSNVLKAGGQIDRLTASLRGFVPRRRFLVAALPAIVGLLPMPGGALFSAPMVEAAAGGTDLPGHRKAGLNHWFRHVWEYTWPLYPGLIAAAEFQELSVGRLSLLQSPLTGLAVLLGVVFLLPRVPEGGAGAEAGPGGPSRPRHAARFLLEMAPFLLVVGLHVGFGLLLVAALGAGILWAAAAACLRRAAGPVGLLRAVFANRGFWGFVVMAFGVKFFGGLLDRSGALAELGAFFSSTATPPFWLAVVLPFVAGMISGITIVYVSTAFPVLLAVPAVAADPLPFLVLAYGAGFVGTLLSPIHACLALGCAWFKGALWRTVVFLLAPSALMLAATAGLFFLYRAWRPF